MQFLSNLRASRHTIYLSRHGLSEYNMVSGQRGSSELSCYTAMHPSLTLMHPSLTLMHPSLTLMLRRLGNWVVIQS